MKQRICLTSGSMALLFSDLTSSLSWRKASGGLPSTTFTPMPSSCRRYRPTSWSGKMQYRCWNHLPSTTPKTPAPRKPTITWPNTTSTSATTATPFGHLKKPTNPAPCLRSSLMRLCFSLATPISRKSGPPRQPIISTWPAAGKTPIRRMPPITRPSFCIRKKILSAPMMPFSRSGIRENMAKKPVFTWPTPS